jgi:hypothetical protein
MGGLAGPGTIGPNFSVPRATPDTFSGFRLELETRTPLLVAVTLYFHARKRLRIERVTGIARRVSSIYSRGAVGGTVNELRADQRPAVYVLPEYARRYVNLYDLRTFEFSLGSLDEVPEVRSEHAIVRRSA